MKNKLAPSLNITRELFIETIDAIKKQYDHDNKCAESFKVVFPNDFISGYDNYSITNQLIKLLQKALRDDHKDSWIEYFLWELDFGKDYKKGCAQNKNGSNIDLSNASKLYDFLIKK